MDATALAFYAIVCGMLSWASPVLGHWPYRFGAGIIVGLAAAAILPSLKMAMGGY